VVVTNRAVAGKTMKELADLESSRGVFLRKLERLGQPMPFTLETRIDRGDVLSLIGAKPDVERAAKDLGYPDRPTVATDMIFVGLGIFIGGLVGLLTVVVGGLPLTLTASGGALIMGLVFGWLRAVRPTFGRIPEAAMWVFETVGLTVFIGVVGLSAGPSFVAGLQKSGVSLILVGLVVAVLPPPSRFSSAASPEDELVILRACVSGDHTAAYAPQEKARAPSALAIPSVCAGKLVDRRGQSSWR
jgi:putative transport protein